MEREFFFAALALFISVVDLFFFWKGIFQNDIIPHPFTFFIWMIVLSISTIELAEREEWWGVMATSLVTLSCLFAFLWGLSRWNKIWMNWVDGFFLIAGILLILYWRIETEYSNVLLLMITIDACAYAVSFKKAWLQPYTEKSLPYFISVGTYVATIFSISVWNFETLGMWIWTASINLTFACFILGRQYSMRK